MSLDLFGAQNVANNQATQMLTNVGFANQVTGKAHLFVFTQRFIPDQFRRPHNYNFGGEFRSALQENLERAQRGTYNHLNSMMLEVPTAKSAILPAAQGQHMNLKNFGEQWTYILIVDNDRGLSPLGLVSTIPSRMLYSGWIMDEPLTKKNFNAVAGPGQTIGAVEGTWIPNENAVFSTTHHTTLTVQQHMAPSGMVQQVQTTGDFDYVSPVIQNLQMNGEQLFDIQPGKVVNSIIEDPANPLSFQIAGAPIQADNKSLEIPSEINAPTYHLRQIVGGMADTIKMVKSPTFETADVFGGSDVLLSTMSSLMQTGHNVIPNDLNPSLPFTLGELMRKYGSNLQITVCKQPRELQYEWMPAQAPSRRNVLTSIISSSLPALLAQFGLAEVAFRYNSYQPVVGGLGSTNGERGIFQLLNVATLYGGSDTEKSSAWDHLQQYLKITLWPIIKENAGEFDVVVHCSLAGVSLINLQLLDEILEQGLVESNNLLGGLNTPLVGTSTDLMANAGQLYNVVKDIGATGTPMDGMFNMPGDGSLPLF